MNENFDMEEFIDAASSVFDDSPHVGDGEFYSWFFRNLETLRRIAQENPEIFACPLAENS